MTEQNSKYIKDLWSIANELRGSLNQSDFVRLFVGLLLIRRIDCMEEGKREKISKTWEDNINVLSEEALDARLLKLVAPFECYNTSAMSLEEVVKDKYGVSFYKAFEEYNYRHSENIQQILTFIDFPPIVSKLLNANRLEYVVKSFCNIELSPVIVSDDQMKALFGAVVQSFISQDKSSSEFFTPQSIADLMTLLCIHEVKKGRKQSVYDGTCGPGTILRASEQLIKSKGGEVRLFGQDIDVTSMSMLNALSFMLSEFYLETGMGNTLTYDYFKDKKFDYVFSDAPINLMYSSNSDFSVNDDRFSSCQPVNRAADALFLANGISKLNENGRMVAMTAGNFMSRGPLGWGDNNFRKYLIENDLLEAIIALPNNMLHSTSIPTFLWVISKNKSAERKGKVQLIDATKIYVAESRAQNSFSQENIDTILSLYNSFEENKLSKIVDASVFAQYNLEVVQANGKSRTIEVSGVENVQKYVNEKVLPFLKEGERLNIGATRKGCVINFREFFTEEEEEETVDIEANLQDNLQTIHLLESELFPELSAGIAMEEEPEMVSESDAPKAILANCASLKKGTAPKGIKVPDHGNSYLVMTKDIKADSTIDIENCQQMQMEPYMIEKFVELKEGDLIVSLTGTIGKVAVLDKETIDKAGMPILLNTGLVKVDAHEELCAQDYLRWIFTSNIFKRFKDNIAKGSYIPNLTLADLKRFEFPLPSLTEQKRKAAFLNKKVNSLNHLMDALDKYKHNLDLLKNKIINDRMK